MKDNLEEIRFQLRAKAHAFLDVAELCVETLENRAKYRTVILHLVAHSLEVFFKSYLVSEECDLNCIKAKYGHNLSRLWRDLEQMEVCAEIRNAAKKAWDFRRDHEDWPQDDFSVPADEVLKDHMISLSRLHMKEGGSALRYVTKPGEKGPAPLFLIDTFKPVVNSVLRS